MKCIFSILLFIPYILYSQNKIYGKVIDEKTNEPIPYVSVYINGSSIGTVTNTDGLFSLMCVFFPCEVIFSHISYNVQLLSLKEKPDSLVVILSERKVLIDEINIYAANLRQQNFETFKKWFIGDDKWGKNAFVQNDSVLLYKHVYKKKTEFVKNKKYLYKIDDLRSRLKDFQLAEDSSSFTYIDDSVFIIQSRAPLVINMPLLGYILHLDLVYASIQPHNIINNLYKFVGYCYFEPIIPKSKSEEKRFDKNRLIVYYNSGMHFCRSLYAKELDLNGYRLYKEYTQRGYIKELVDTCIININNNLKGITKLKGKQFSIFYYSELSGKPKVILEPGFNNYIKSTINFKKDTCYIMSNGNIPDLSIMFKGTIGNKMIGNMLPGDYKPIE